MRISLPARWLLALLAIVVIPFTGKSDSLFALRFEQYLESLRQQAGIPGLSAAIVQDGSVAWEAGFGEADIDRKIRAAPDTPYPIAGLTTLLTAVQTLQCVERGQLGLDTRIVDFFPAFGEPGATLRDTLSHVSAGRYVYQLSRYDGPAAGIKSCSGKTLRGTLNDEILDRLGMSDSVPGHDFASWSPATRDQFSASTVQRYGEIMGRLAKAYRANGRSRPTATTFAPSTGLTGATGIVSTVRDLARFQSALDDGVLLDNSSRSAALTAPTLSDRRLSPHALGWFVQSYQGQLVAWQFGVIPDSYSALLMTLPQRGVTLILLANSDGLVEPFSLVNGDISVSPFARLFLGLFS